MNETIFYTINSIAGQSQVIDQLVIFLSDRFAYLLVLGLLISFFYYKDKRQGARDILMSRLYSTRMPLSLRTKSNTWTSFCPLGAVRRSSARRLIGVQRSTDFMR